MRSGATILLVDDELFNLRVVRINLERLEYRVLTALDGEEGLSVAAEHRPDVILLDLLMPRVDGFTMLLRLKESPALRHIPVIVVSANDDDEIMELALRAGALALMPKPIDMSSLTRKLQSLP